MGLIDDIKNDVKKSGSSQKSIVRFKPGNKVRVRFLQELDDGLKIPFHDNYTEGVKFPCREVFGRECPTEYHDSDEYRHRNQYSWSVWNHEAKEVQILIGPVNNYSPVPLITGFNDTYETITDRDYVITKNGTGTDQSWSVVPLDKSVFKNSKAVPFSKKKALAIIEKAWPLDDEEDSSKDEEEEEEKPAKKKPASKTSKAAIKEDEDKESEDYGDMTPKELYQLCVERDIEAETRKPESYYIKKLKAADAESDEDEDEW